MMQLVTDVHRQQSAHTQSQKLMVYIAATHINVVRQPRMRQSAFDFKVPIAPGKRYIAVDAYRYAW